MVYVQLQTPTLGKFWKVLQLTILMHFMNIWSIFRPFGTFCGFYWSFGIFFPVLVWCIKKNLATLGHTVTYTLTLWIYYLHMYSILPKPGSVSSASVSRIRMIESLTAEIWLQRKDLRTASEAFVRRHRYLRYCKSTCFFISNPLCLSSSLALHFLRLFFFWIHRPVNRDDRHLLAHAMASTSQSHGSWQSTCLCLRFLWFLHADLIILCLLCSMRLKLWAKLFATNFALPWKGKCFYFVHIPSINLSDIYGRRVSPFKRTPKMRNKCLRQFCFVRFSQWLFSIQFGWRKEEKYGWLISEPIFFHSSVLWLSLGKNWKKSWKLFDKMKRKNGENGRNCRVRNTSQSNPQLRWHH
jgi:hypothetical protein